MMSLNVRIDAGTVILSGFGRLMNDPRYVDASRDVGDLLAQGFTKFVLDLQGVRETGSSLLGLLTTLTRKIRREAGEMVVAALSKDMERFINDMGMDDYWDIFPSVQEAHRFLAAAKAKEP
jgi:anti-sigma B factor antagonist